MHSMQETPVAAHRGTKKEVVDSMMHDEDYYVLALLVLSGAEEFSQHSGKNETYPLDSTNDSNFSLQNEHVLPAEKENC